jgi:Photosynthesis system II assembly factor YCF48
VKGRLSLALIVVLAAGCSGAGSSTDRPPGSPQPEVTAASSAPTARATPDLGWGTLSTLASDGASTVWALADRELYLSLDGGLTWHITAPPDVSPKMMLASAFQADHGWVVTVGEGAGRLTLNQTSDGGKSWTSGSVSVDPTPDGPGSVWIDPIDAKTVWLSIEFPSDTSESWGYARYSADGGRSWRKPDLPFAGPVSFLNGQEGWIAGGTRHELMHTTDGGSSWTKVALEVPGQYAGRQEWFGLPTFLPGGGILPVALVSTRDAPLVMAIFLTADQGRSWQPSSTLETGLDQRSTPVLVSGSGEVDVVVNGGIEALPQAVRTVPLGIDAGSIQSLAGVDGAWLALAESSNCTKSASDATCVGATWIERSTDSGARWTPLQAPAGN